MPCLPCLSTRFHWLCPPHNLHTTQTHTFVVYSCIQTTHTMSLSYSQKCSHRLMNSVERQVDKQSILPPIQSRDRLLPTATTLCCGYVLNVNILRPSFSHWSRTKPDYCSDKDRQTEKESVEL